MMMIMNDDSVEVYLLNKKLMSHILPIPSYISSERYPPLYYFCFNVALNTLNLLKFIFT